MADEASRQSRRRSRLARQACDACRLRRVKCSFDPEITSTASGDQAGNGPTESSKCCRCVRLELPCSFNLPSRPRGPKRKKVSIEQIMPRPGSSPSVPAPLVSVGANGPVSQRLSPAGEPSHPLDGLCSRDLLERMMHDYLRYLYPLIPVVHRPSFRRDLDEHRDREDKVFMGLTLALASLVVGIMPSRFAEYQAHDPPLRFTGRNEMISYCQNVLMNLREPAYFDQVNFQKFAISYLMQIAFFQLGELNRSRMMEVEALQLARLLNFHQISQYEGLNCIETQLRKKAFWLLFYVYVHSQLQNLRNERLTFLDPMLLASINLHDLIPLEVEDELIFADRVHTPDPGGPPTLIESFNIHSRVFWTALVPYSTNASTGPLQQQEACPCRRARDRAANVAHLEARLQELKYSLDMIPSHLRQWAPVANHDDSVASDEEAIKASQFATMRANLHVTQLWLQSIIIDQLDAAAQCEPATGHSNADSGGSDNLCNRGNYAQDGRNINTHRRRELWAHREEICRQLLHVLHATPELDIEPNGMHTTFKVRDMAVGLLACPYEREDSPAYKRAAQYVNELTVILSRLDHSEKASTVYLQSWVDTDRVRGGLDVCALPLYGEWWK